MCRRRYFAVIILLIVLRMAAACAPSGTRVVVVPTLAELPSETPTSTDLPTLTPTLRPTDSPTPNPLETQIAALNATNSAAQQTLDALLTGSAPTSTLMVMLTNTLPATLTPSLTITNTLPPSETPPAVVAMQPQTVYAVSAANLRTCAHRDCERIAQLQPGEAVMATGTILGEAIDAVHGSWFQVEYQGRVLYVYSQLVSINPPAPPTSAPVYIPPPVEAAPISLPPAPGGGSCPSLSATCGSLTCEQAYACLAAGNGRLDRDNDGIPCESVCLGS